MKDILKYAEFFKHEGTRRALKARRTDLLASPYYYLVLCLSPIQRNLDFIVKKSLAATYFPANAVSSALEGLTSVFGMGTGVTPLPWPPSKNEYITAHKVCKGVWCFF